MIAEDNHPKGAIFRFEVPFQKAKASEPMQPQKHTKTATATVPSKKKKILVAEDNAVNRQIIVKTLQSFGVECNVAVDGNEAVQFALAEPYDLILMGKLTKLFSFD